MDLVAFRLLRYKTSQNLNRLRNQIIAFEIILDGAECIYTYIGGLQQVAKRQQHYHYFPLRIYRLTLKRSDSIHAHWKATRYRQPSIPLNGSEYLTERICLYPASKRIKKRERLKALNEARVKVSHPSAQLPKQTHYFATKHGS